MSISNFKRTRRRVLLIFIVLVLAEISYMAGKKIKQRWIVEKTIGSSHWDKRCEEIKNSHAVEHPVVFLGNSLTEMFDVNYYFNDSTLLNAGIVGDFSEGVLERLDDVLAFKPRKIFIEIGINDMIEKIPLEEICANYEKIIKRIQAACPGCTIYVQSNLPVIINRPSLITGDKDVNERVLRQNGNLKRIAEKYTCTYIDIYTHMAAEKDKPSLFIPDGIHLTPKAYQIWTSVAGPYLKE